MNPQPMIVVHDVEATSRWYHDTLGLTSGHGGPEYEQLLYDGQMVMQLHHWEADEHPNLGNAAHMPYGNGVVLWFQTDDFATALQRIETSKPVVLEGPMVNPNANHREIWLQDPSGYKVVVAGPYGELA